jgi:hypothetical protein
MRSRALLLPCSLSMLVMASPARAGAPISADQFQFLIDGSPDGWIPGNLMLRAGVVPGATARALFISGKERQLAVKSVTVNRLLDNIRDEKLPVVLKYHLQLALETGVVGAMAFLNVNLPPKDLHGPLPEGYAFKTDRDEEGHYSEGVLIYRKLTRVFEADKPLYTDEAVARIQVDPLLAEISKLSVTTTRHAFDGRPDEVITHAEMAGGLVAVPVYTSMHRKSEWDPKDLEAYSPYAPLTRYVTVAP